MNAALLAAALSVLAPGAPPREVVVVVLPVMGNDVDAAARNALTDELRAAIEALPGLAVQPKKATAGHLATAQALGLVCDQAKPECVLQLGGLSGADVVVNGVAAAHPSGTALTVRAFEPLTRRERGDMKLSVVPAAAGAGRTKELKLLAVKLLAPERERGAINVVVKQKGAAILIDGIARGTSPLPAPVEVAPGKHEVYVALAGHESVTQSFDVAFDDTARLDIDLPKSAPGGAAAALVIPLAELAAPAAAPPPAAAAAAAPAPSTAVEAAAKKEGATLRVAVYELELAEVEPRVGRVVTDALVNEVRKLQRVSVVGMAEIRAMLDLEAQKQLVGCSDDSCVAEIAEALGVDGMVIGNLARIGDEHVIGLRRLDQREAKAIGSVTQRLKAENGEEFLAVIGPAVEKLFPERQLRAGAKRGVSPEVALRLTPPPLPPWVFWAGTATTGVIAIAAGGAGAFNAYALNDLDTFTSGAPPVDGAELKRKIAAVETSGWGAWALVGASAVAGAATGVASMFTDWQGYAELTLE